MPHDLDCRSLAPSTSAPNVGRSTRARLPARCPPDPLSLSEAGAAALSSESFWSPASPAGASGAVVGFSDAAGVVDPGVSAGAVATGAVVVGAVFELDGLVAADVGGGTAPAFTSTSPFIQGCGWQW